MKPQDILYAPLGWLYSLGVSIRHLLYDEHICASTTVEVPTICVGNLAVGGTGKTPHVEYLIRMLSPHYKIAVLSRGYKRKTRGFVLADEQSTAKTVGDEAMQIHSKFPDIPVAVCEKRVQGVQLLQKHIEGLQLVILDDAYQHRAIQCGFYILLTPYNQLYVEDHPLPWGRLRDIPQQSLRANAIIVTHCPTDIQPIDRRIIRNKLHLPTYQQLYFSQLSYPPINRTGKPLVVTGIAQPKYLMEHIRKQYPKAELLAFADHHRFNNTDIQHILRRAKQCDFVMTTEKDYQRLLQTTLIDALGDKLIILPISVQILPSKSNLERQIRNYIDRELK
ncbi:MAG: tetraacyldisaccharide 4'-kinase [Paludibacteraceae bacterium]